ncbi:phosphatase PAP2 family protein [Veronia nyctiphanis]|uniref:phosphatase PAP2 family protein n=1 Tax=Veronia nyctiphanis TaxID=1278244 RepID=UPI0013759F1B|nr:phosphatase PAP2 family protein [Veronia nyctiphanis]
MATTTGSIQQATKELRPTGKCCGWPSAHTSRAFATAHIAKRNYDKSGLTTLTKDMLIYSTFLTAYATGWARVEAGEHYPSQVFIGAAYGNFLSSVLYDSTESLDILPMISIEPDFMMIGVHYEF